MSAVHAEQAGRRVEEVLDRLAATGDREVAAAAEELVRVLMDFYGGGLARIVELLDAGPLAKLLGDELVSSLLVLHGLHPEDRDTRIARALGTVSQHAVEVAEFDEVTGTLRLRSAAAGGCGCGSTGGAVQQEVQDALACFAPEVTAVELETVAAEREPVLLQIGRPSPVEAP
jgi:Fe-S cluster biogenesis protein NfuA